MVSSLNNSHQLYKLLRQTTELYLVVSLTHPDSIECDLKLKQAVQPQQTVVYLYSNAVWSQQVLQITEVIKAWKHYYAPHGCLTIRVERLTRFNCIEAIPALSKKAS